MPRLAPKSPKGDFCPCGVISLGRPLRLFREWFGCGFCLADPVGEGQVDLSFAGEVITFGIKVNAFSDGSHSSGIENIQDIKIDGSVAFENILAQGKIEIVKGKSLPLCGLLSSFIVATDLNIKSLLKHKARGLSGKPAVGSIVVTGENISAINFGVE